MECNEERNSTTPLQKQNSTKWTVFGYKFPSSEIVFFSQMIIILIVVLASVYNLSTHDKNVSLWTTLLSGSLGYVLPNPSIHSRTIKE